MMWHHTIFCFKKYFFVVLLSLLLIIMRREQKYQKFIIILLFFFVVFTKLSQAFLVLDSFFVVCFIHILYTMDFFFCFDRCWIFFHVHEAATFSRSWESFWEKKVSRLCADFMIEVLGWLKNRQFSKIRMTSPMNSHNLVYWPLFTFLSTLDKSAKEIKKM